MPVRYQAALRPDRISALCNTMLSIFQFRQKVQSVFKNLKPPEVQPLDPSLLTTACTISPGRTFIRFAYPVFRVQSTTARSAPATKRGIDHRGRTSHTCLNINGSGGTVPGTGAAFHASVPIFNRHTAVSGAPDALRADLQTHPADRTFSPVKPQCHYISKIHQGFHRSSSSCDQP